MLTFSLLLTLCSGSAVYDPQPQQVHLSLGSKASEIVVTWLTTNHTPDSVVEYGSQHELFNLNLKSEGTSQLFTDGGSEKRTMYIHRVFLKNLKTQSFYAYHVGSSNYGWSEVFWFRALSDESNWSPRFAVFGDLGVVNGKSIPRLQQEVQRSHFDAILHVGDMAYDLHDDNARVGDEFLRQIQPIAAYLPYQTVVGNHEYA